MGPSILAKSRNPVLRHRKPSSALSRGTDWERQSGRSRAHRRIPAASSEARSLVREDEHMAHPAAGLSAKLAPRVCCMNRRPSDDRTVSSGVAHCNSGDAAAEVSDLRRWRQSESTRIARYPADRALREYRGSSTSVPLPNCHNSGRQHPPSPDQTLVRKREWGRS
jgi:hypothetical protein